MGERIPTFETREQEAAFWEETGLEHLAPGQLEAAELERPRRPLSTTFAVRFDPETVERLRALARLQGIGPTQLVRRWVMERLRIERAAGALAMRPGEYQELESVLRRRVLDTLMEQIPQAVEAAMREVLDRADQERRAL
jgi:hypothetical protein